MSRSKTPRNPWLAVKVACAQGLCTGRRRRTWARLDGHRVLHLALVSSRGRGWPGHVSHCRGGGLACTLAHGTPTSFDWPTQVTRLAPALEDRRVLPSPRAESRPCARCWVSSLQLAPKAGAILTVLQAQVRALPLPQHCSRGARLQRGTRTRVKARSQREFLPWPGSLGFFPEGKCRAEAWAWGRLSPHQVTSPPTPPHPRLS